MLDKLVRGRNTRPRPLGEPTDRVKEASLGPSSILDAIQQGIWDFEPNKTEGEDFSATRAMPGTKQKVDVLARRLREGLPLWHPRDQAEYDDPLNDKLAL
jgi:hypothetical protein